VKLVIDANCWRLYIDEKLAVATGVGHLLFEPDDLSSLILFDEGLQIRHQYSSLKVPYSEQLFDLWFENQTLNGHVQLVSIKGKANLLAELKQLGVPKGEHVYFRVAVHGRAEYLISLDVDFYDPRQKLAGERKKLSLLNSGKGPVCKHMKNEHKVIICCPAVFSQSVK
jgi:hypothetical protein